VTLLRTFEINGNGIREKGRGDKCAEAIKKGRGRGIKMGKNNFTLKFNDLFTALYKEAYANYYYYPSSALYMAYQDSDCGLEWRGLKENENCFCC
jgi:hypothetical protein